MLATSKWSNGLSVNPREMADELNETGFACAAGVVSDEWLERARGFIEALLAENGNKFFSIIRPGDNAGSPLAEIATDPAIRKLLVDLTAAVCPPAVDDEEEVYNVLRVIAGPKGDSGSLEFHYDPSVITMLVPIFMPHNEPGQSGELVVFPNGRPFRRSLLVNLAEKALLQNRVGCALVAKKVKLDQHTRLLYPGNVYFFWGYRTCHGNLPCAPNSLRATLLLHYGSPHGKSWILNAIRNGRKVVETIRRKVA